MLITTSCTVPISFRAVCMVAFSTCHRAHSYTFSVNSVIASLHRQNSGQYKHKFDKFSEQSLLKCRDCAIQVGHRSRMSRQGSQQEIMQQAIKNLLRIMQKYKSGYSVFVHICRFTGLMIWHEKMCYNVIMILMPAVKLAMKRVLCLLVYVADVSRQCCRY